MRGGRLFGGLEDGLVPLDGDLGRPQTVGEEERHVLQNDGRGLCAFDRGQTKPKLYRITSWELSGFDIRIGLTSVDEDTVPIYMKIMKMKGVAHAYPSYTILHLEVGNELGDWGEKIILERERVAEARSRAMKKRMDVYAQSGQ